MKHLKLIISAVLITLIAGCAKERNYPVNYVGTWTNSQSEITLNTDSSYVLKSPGISETNGTYKTAPNTLMFFDKAGACPDSVGGSYDWRYIVETVTGTFYPTLTLTLLNDTCGIRSVLIPGKYRRQ